MGGEALEKVGVEGSAGEPGAEAQPEPVAAAGVKAPAGAGAAEAGAAGAKGAAVEKAEAGAELDPKIAALLEETVQAAVARVKDEYEGKGGHLSKLKSKYDKQVAQLKRELEARQDAEVQGALALVDDDPVKAAEILAQQVQQLRGRDAMSRQEEALQEWAGGILEQLGLDPEDEAVAEVAQRVGPLTEEGASYAFLGEMSKLAISQRETRAQKAEQELKKTIEGLGALVEQQVAKALAASGIGAVDAGEKVRPAEGNPIRDITDPGRLLAMGFKVESTKGGGRRGRQ